MGFAERQAAPKRTGGQPLLILKHLQDMPAEDVPAALAYLRSDHSAASVADGFTQEGYPASEAAVANWRKADRAGRTVEPTT